MHTLLSIVVITRNDIEGLERTLSSFDVQHPLIQVVVIDGSDSSYLFRSSLFIIESVSYIIQRSTGLFEAMNEGLEASHGQYVLFMNGGDKFFNNRSLLDCLSVLKTNSANPPLSFVFISHIITPNNNSIGFNPPTLQISFSAWNILHFFFPWAFWPCHQSFIFNTASHKKIPYSNASLGSDEYVMRSFLSFPCKFVDIVLSEIDTGGRSSTPPINKRHFVQQFNHFIKMKMYRRLFRLVLFTFISYLGLSNYIDAFRIFRYRILALILPIPLLILNIIFPIPLQK